MPTLKDIKKKWIKRDKSFMKKKLIFIFIVALAVRLISLNQSLWLDEGTTARVATQYSLWQIIPQFSVADFHPPLYYLLIRVITYVFGSSEIALRMLSVLFSLAASWFVYITGRRMKNEQVGFWAAILFLFNPLIIYYSQEARMYMMATCLLSVAFYYVVKILSDNKKTTPSNVAYNLRDILTLNSILFLSFLTFYGTVFFIAALYVIILLRKKYLLLLQLLPGFVCALLLDLPLLYQQFVHSREALHIVANWKSVLGNVTPKNILLFPIKFSVGRISFEPKKFYYLVSGLFSILVFFFGAKGAFKKPLLWQVFGIPLLIGLIFSFFSPLLQYFRFIYLIIPLSIALSFGLQKNWQRLLIVGGFFIFSGMYLFIPNFHRENWKGLAKTIKDQRNIYAIPSSMDALRYYDRNLVIHDLRNINKEATPPLITVIPYTWDIYGFDYRKELQNKKYTLIHEYTYRGLIKEEWKR
jgi:uncharacterized membrane protein